MNIFDKRPLSLILCIMLGAFVFFAFYNIPNLAICALIFLTLLFLCTFIPTIKQRIKPLFIRVVIICTVFSVIASSLYFNVWFKAYDRYTDEVTLYGTVTEIDENAYQKGVIIKTDNVNGDPFSRYKLKAYLESEKYYGYSIGSKVYIKGRIEPLKSDDSSFNTESYYASQGISGIVSDVTEFSITGIGEYPLEHKITVQREQICRRIIYLSNKDVGGLLCALLLGDRSALPERLQLDFARIGIAHILALSGMHLAVLAIGLSRLLQFLKLGKKPATVITVIFTFLYMALTGFSVSVTRAGVMLIISSLLYLFARTRDSLTSLLIAVSFICILQPYSVYDLSLWLSAFATLGIVVMSEYLSEKYSKASFIKWLKTSLLASIFSISATFAICITQFNGISLVAPLTTLLFSPIVELFLYVGTVLLFVGSLIPVNILLNPIGRFIVYLSGIISDFEWVYVSTNFKVIEFLSIVFSICFFGFFIFKIKRKKIAISALCLFLCTIFSTSAALTYNSENESQIVYYSNDSEQIIMGDGGDICVIEIANYRKSSAYEAISSATDSKFTLIDKYIFTHYSSGLDHNVNTLLKSMLIKEIYVPEPKNENENKILESILKTVSDYRATLIVYESGELIKVGRHTVAPVYHSEIGETKKNILIIRAYEKIFTYLNVDSLDGETKSMALETIAASDAIIFGRHESGTDDYKFTYKIENAEAIIFSSEKITMNSSTFNFYTERNAIFSPEKVYLKR